MLGSETDIANDALIAVGQTQISALSDASTAARLCARLLPRRRDELLREYDWNCARKDAVLGALEAAPLFGFARAFQLPSDCLCMRATDQDENDPNDYCGTVAWEVRGSTVVTNLAAPLKVLYTFRLTDVAQMDSQFTRVLALRMAQDLALPLANSVALRDEVVRDYDRQIRIARGSSFREGRKEAQVPTWIRARY